MFEITNQKKVFQVHEALVSTNPFSKFKTSLSKRVYFPQNFGATKQQKHFKAAIGDCSSKRLPLACMEMVYLPIPIQHENQGFHLGKYTSPMDRMRMRKQNKQITRIPSHLAVSLVILPLCHIACAIRQREHLKRRKPLVGWVGGNGCK